MPSLHEQSSGPVHEAMVLGTPVAASRVADVPELLGDGAGLLFDPLDVADIASCIRRLWEERSACADMARRARDRIHRIRSWKTWADRHEEIYAACAEERTRSRRDGLAAVASTL
jgi:glycosyltransferase involved in cell wall biosynthesis